MKNKSWITFFIFIVTLYIIKLVISKFILSEIKIDYEFTFNNFIIYTYIFSLITYLFKITFLTGLFKTSFFVFDFNHSKSILDILIQGEIFKLILSEGSKIFSYYYLFDNMTLEQFSTFKSYFNFSNILGFDNIKSFEYLINAVNILDILYILFVTLLFSEAEKIPFLKSIKIIVLPYLLLFLIIGIIKTFLSF